MSLVYVDEDPWLMEYVSCEALCSELAVRVETFWNSVSSASNTADIRLRLRQCDQQLTQLRSTLFSDDPERFITSDERERRERCLETLYDRARHLRTQFLSQKPSTPGVVDANRDILLGSNSGKLAHRVQGDTYQFNPEIMRQRQAQVLEEQDRGLEALSKIIARQKNIAQSIDSEVTNQTEIVSNLADSMGHLGTRTEGATRRTATLLTRDNTCGYWLVAILLLLAIIVVAAL